jgi:hypothetical protein
MGKVSKVYAEYKTYKTKGKCKYCIHYHPTTHTCDIVLGKVVPSGGCKYWKSY